MNPYQRELISLRKSYAITMGRLIDAQEEVARLTDENAICRDAIEEAIALVTEWEDDHDSDSEQGAARATRRMLGEAVGKACPRLLMERPEGQKLYGLRWRELCAEIARLTDLVEEQQRTITALLPPGETSTAWAVHLARLEGRISRLTDTLRAIATMDCYTREGEEPVHLLMMRLAREALGEGG